MCYLSSNIIGYFLSPRRTLRAIGERNKIKLVLCITPFVFCFVVLLCSVRHADEPGKRMKKYFLKNTHTKMGEGETLLRVVYVHG